MNIKEAYHVGAQAALSHLGIDKTAQKWGMIGALQNKGLSTTGSSNKSGFSSTSKPKATKPVASTGSSASKPSMWTTLGSRIEAAGKGFAHSGG